MANALYHKLPDNSYMNVAAVGGPAIWRVQFDSDSSAWYAQFSWDCINYVKYPAPFATAAQAQTSLDNVISQINAGTFGP